MQSLDILSIRHLLQALEQIHSTMDLAALPRVFFSALNQLVPDAMLTLEELDAGSHAVRRSRDILRSHRSQLAAARTEEK
jgi:hypothetical protein